MFEPGDVVAIYEERYPTPEMSYRDCIEGSATQVGGCFRLLPGGDLKSLDKRQRCFLKSDVAVCKIILRLRQAILIADLALDRGDVDEAILAMDRPFVWRAMEVQSLARLAAALLEQTPSSPAAVFRKAVALALFIQQNSTSSTLTRCELPLPDNRWK